MRLPGWLKKPADSTTHLRSMKRALRGRGLHTVCESARCPNMGECFASGTATFMIMGDVCMRSCGFCAVRNGTPAPLDSDEPRRVAEQICDMNLTHAVVTSVTRDDLADGGAGHFVNTIREIRTLSPATRIEILVPDFDGRETDIKSVCAAGPDVFNHNIETVRRLTPEVRNKASYERSLDVLRKARSFLSKGIIKSGLMLGLGEREAEVYEAMRDLKSSGVDVVTIGQYLRPSRDALEVVEYVEPSKFHMIAEEGRRFGFKNIFAGPFVRNSYHAAEQLS